MARNPIGIYTRKTTVIRCNICIFELKMIVDVGCVWVYWILMVFLEKYFFFLVSSGSLHKHSIVDGLDDKSRRQHISIYKFIDHIADICECVPAEDSCFVVLSYLCIEFLDYELCGFMVEKYTQVEMSLINSYEPPCTHILKCEMRRFCFCCSRISFVINILFGFRLNSN